MDLKIYDAFHSRKKKTGPPTITINFNSGTFVFSQSAAELTDIQDRTYIKVGVEKTTGEWYLWKIKTKDGFLVRATRAGVKGSSLMFNCAKITADIAIAEKYEKGTGKILVGTQPVTETDQGIHYWPLIIAKLKA